VKEWRGGVLGPAGAKKIRQAHRSDSKRRERKNMGRKDEKGAGKRFHNSQDMLRERKGGMMEGRWEGEGEKLS